MRRFFRLIGVLLAVLVPNQLRADHLYAYRNVVEDAYDFLVYIPDSYYNSDKPLPGCPVTLLFSGLDEIVSPKSAEKARRSRRERPLEHRPRRSAMTRRRIR